MLHGLLLILKIIGIILLVIIGLLLLIVLSILFVPVRYRGKLSYFEKPEGFLKVSWLLHILSFRLQYEEDVKAVVRVFGYPVMKQTLFGDEETDEFEEEIPEQAAEAASDVMKKGGDVAEDAGRHGGEMPERKAEADPPEAVVDPLEAEADSLKPVADLPEPEGQTGKAADETKGKKHFGSKSAKIHAPFSKLRFSFQRICDKLRELKEKKDSFLKFWNDETNKKTFSLVLRQCKRLLRHILPRKVQGRIAFGFDDPYTTGQVLMYASPFLGWYHRWLELEPHFDQEMLEGELAIKGRIRVGTVLFLGFQVYRDRNFRKLLKAFRER